jgi:hypothetical protein
MSYRKIMTDITVDTIILQKRKITMFINHTVKISINYTTPPILILCHRWRWVASLHSIALSQAEEPFNTHWVGIGIRVVWVDTRGNWMFWRREKSLAYAGYWTRSASCPTCSQVTLPTAFISKSQVESRVGYIMAGTTATLVSSCCSRFETTVLS